MYCELDDINLYYTVYNDGIENNSLDTNSKKPIMIFLHGGPGLNDHSVYVPFWKTFSNIVQLVFIDMRGHGKSIQENELKDKWNLTQWGQDIKHFCDKLHIKNPIVTGFSFGGWVAYSYLVQFPNHASKIIFCNSEPHVDNEQRIKAYNIKDASGNAERTIHQLEKLRGDPITAKIYVETLYPFFGAEKHYPDEEPSDCILNFAVWEKFDKDEYYDFDFREDLKTLNLASHVEILSISGGKDPEHPWQCAKQAMDLIGKKNALFYLIEQAGDPVERDCPDETTRVINTFINQGIVGVKHSLNNQSL